VKLTRMKCDRVALLRPQFSYLVSPQSDFGPFGPLRVYLTIVSDPFPKSRVVARRAACTSDVNFSLD